MEDRAQAQVAGLDVAEVPLDVFEVLAGADHGGGVQFAGGDGGAQHAEPVEGGFLILYLVITLPASTPIFPAPASLPAWAGTAVSFPMLITRASLRITRVSLRMTAGSHSGPRPRP